MKYAVNTSAAKTLLTGILIVCFVLLDPCLDDKTIWPCSKAMQAMFTNLKMILHSCVLRASKGEIRTMDHFIFNLQNCLSTFMFTEACNLPNCIFLFCWCESIQVMAFMFL